MMLQQLDEEWPARSIQQNGDFTQCEAYSKPRRKANYLSKSSTSIASWICNLFNRSPKAIRDKSQHYLSISRARSNSSSSSSDLESLDRYSSTLLNEERHSHAASTSRSRARFISDAIIGLSDGLTVPFALTAGLSALGNTKVVIFAGLAELTAGSISMGLGGYLAAKSEEDSYTATLTSTERLVSRSRSDAAASVKDVFEPYGLPESLKDELALNMAKNPNLVQFLMHFQHAQPGESSSRAVICALTIACGYFVGGFIPLVPYFLVSRDEVAQALWWSFVVMAISLFAFGYGKTCFVGGWSGAASLWLGSKGGMQMLLVGSIAAFSAMGFVRFFDSWASWT